MNLATLRTRIASMSDDQIRERLAQLEQIEHTADALYATFTPEDKIWPRCICGCSAQAHPHTIADVCRDRCSEYRPTLPLTPNQTALLELRKEIA